MQRGPAAVERPAHDYLLLVWIGLGSGLGAAARVLAGHLAQGWLPAPWPTLLINLLGSGAIAALMIAARERNLIGARGQLFWTTGFLGGYTTFSAFAYDVVRLWEDGSAALAFIYGAGSILSGLLAAWTAACLARALLATARR